MMMIQSSPLHPRRTSRGFTLIELVLVLTLLALIMGAAITVLNRGGLVEGAQEDRVKGDIQTISTALDAYSYGAGRYPTTEQGLMALTEKPGTPPIPDRWHRYMNEIPVDPWKQPYKYRYPAQKSKDPYDVFSVGKDGAENTPDDLGNWKAEAAQ
jgi:general secretion pathway protein G